MTRATTIANGMYTAIFVTSLLVPQIIIMLLLHIDADIPMAFLQRSTRAHRELRQQISCLDAIANVDIARRLVLRDLVVESPGIMSVITLPGTTAAFAAANIYARATGYIAKRCSKPVITLSRKDWHSSAHLSME
jgi:hypothetical protein